MDEDGVDGRAADSTISSATQRCHQLLTQCLDIRTLMEREWAENRLADFNLWASGIGADATETDKISLNARLSGKPTLLTVLIRLLQMLIGFLKECLTLAVNLRADDLERHVRWLAHDDQEDKPDDGTRSKSPRRQCSPTHGPARSPSPWSDQSSLKSTFDDNGQEENGRLAEAMIGVESTMDQLNNLGFAIRRAGTSLRLHKADSRFDHSDHSDLETFLKFWVLVTTKSGSPVAEGDSETLNAIQTRLIEANLVRRNRFLYAQRHSRRLLKSRQTLRLDSSPAVSGASINESLPLYENEQPESLSRRSALPTAGELPDATHGPLADNSTATGLESATEILKEKAQGRDSQITSTALRVRYPNPPKIRPGARVFKCPCCCHTLDLGFSLGGRWRRHLAEDIAPYTCIYDDCPKPQATFVTRRAWMNHMAGEEHPNDKVWSCLICADGVRYESKLSLSDHIKNNHERHVSADQIPTLLDACVQTVSATDFSCPLCSKDEAEETRSSLEHIAEHIHSFALLSLPWAPDAPVVNPGAFEEASTKVVPWLGADDCPVPDLAAAQVAQNSTMDEASLFFANESYFGEHESKHSDSSMPSIDTDRDLEGFDVTGPLLFAENDHTGRAPAGLGGFVSTGSSAPESEASLDKAMSDEYSEPVKLIVVLRVGRTKLGDWIRSRRTKDGAVYTSILSEMKSPQTQSGPGELFTATSTSSLAAVPSAQPPAPASVSGHIIPSTDALVLPPMSAVALQGLPSPASDAVIMNETVLAVDVPAPRKRSYEPDEVDGGELRPMTVVELPVWLSKSRKDISSTFANLEWKQRYRLQDAIQNPDASPFRVNRSQIVIARNRYGNVQPWDASRVRLKKPIDGSDYINASPITLKTKASAASAEDGTVLASPPSQLERRYIATQGPKESTFLHFWQMVLQESSGPVGVVIMLTRHYEGSKEKCGHYYPVDMENPTMAFSVPELEEEEGSGGKNGTTEKEPATYGPMNDLEPWTCQIHLLSRKQDGDAERLVAVMDTGAGVNVIGRKLAESLGDSIDRNGSEILCFGESKVRSQGTLQLAFQSKHDSITRLAKFHVVEDFGSHQALLGAELAAEIGHIQRSAATAGYKCELVQDRKDENEVPWRYTSQSGTIDIEPGETGSSNDESNTENSCTVTLVSSIYDREIGCEVRELDLRIGQSTKVVRHYLFDGWPDFGRPEGKDRKALMRLMRVSQIEAGDSPRIVHDSAGVGRTGTFIALDFLLGLLESGALSQPADRTFSDSGLIEEEEGSSDAELREDRVFRVVNTLREQRMMMVMNELQYGFIYEVVRDAFLEKYTASSSSLDEERSRRL